MKRNFFARALAMICAMLLLTGCGNSTVSSEPEQTEGRITPRNGSTYRIGFSNCGQNHPLFAEIQRSFETAASRQPNWEVILKDANNTSEQQYADIEDLITRECDAVVLIPNSSSDLSAAVQKLNEAAIPAITVCRAVEQGEVLSNVGCDDYEIGRMAANYIATKLNGRGVVLNLEGTPGASTAIQRSRGFRDVISQYPNIELLSGFSADFRRTRALQITTDLIRDGVKFDAVWATNDEQCGGVAQALQNSGRRGVLLVGCNLQKDGCERIQTGQQSADITYPPGMGAKATEILLEYFNGDDYPAAYNMQLDLVTAANLESFLDQAY